MCFSRGNGKELPAKTKGWKSMSCFQATGKLGCPCASEGFLVCNLAMRLLQRMDKLDKSTGDVCFVLDYVVRRRKLNILFQGLTKTAQK